MRVTQILVFSIVLTIAAGRADAQDDARAIIDKGIAALGGEKKLAEIKGQRLKSTGTLHVAGGLPFTSETIYQLPDKYKETLRLTTAKQTLTSGWDVTDGAWMDRDGEAVKLIAKLKNEIRDGVHASNVLRLLPLKSGDYETLALEEINVDGRPAAGVKVSMKDRGELRLYFDKESGLPVKSERRALNMEMKETQEHRLIRSYQEIEGIKWPKKIEVFHDGEKFMDEEVQSVELIELFEATAFAKPVKKSRSQEPKKPYPYVEEEITYQNKKADAKFAGTLTLPQGAGPFPAVLLITGSGSQDRNETIFNHRPFLVLADFLTRRGIAVLRVDDRGVGGSTGSAAKATTEDFAEDVRAGLAFLRGRKEIDSKRIGLIGHSEGGLIAPMVAAGSDEVAFIVLLAGPGLPGEQILQTQGAAVLKATGVGENLVAIQRQLQRDMFSVLKEEKDPANLEKRLREAITAVGDKLDDDNKKLLTAFKSQVEAQIPMLLSPWIRFFLIHDPRPTLIKVRCPVLALNGEKDVQVDAKENLTAIRKALEEGGNSDFTIKELPKLNHMFQTCETGAVSEYGQLDETFAPAALEIIGEWISQRTSRVTV